MAERIAEPKHYVAGAFVSNGLVWIVFILLISLKGVIPLNIFTILHTLSSSLGGIIAGYLTAGRSSDEHIKVGFTTGLVSSIAYTIITLAVMGAFETSKWIWMGFIFGGIVGGALRRMKAEKFFPVGS